MHEVLEEEEEDNNSYKWLDSAQNYNTNNKIIIINFTTFSQNFVFESLSMFFLIK